MSNDAINWALAQPIKHSTAKFVLVVMANCADGQEWLAWPSVAHLAESTGQDRKTVLENIKRLIALGHIADTGSRKGSTRQVPVYRLNGNSAEGGTVPNLPANKPEITHQQSQICTVPVPKTEPGTIRNHQGIQKETPRQIVLNVALPAWLPAQVWKSWIDYRTSINAALSPQAATLCIAKLELLRSEGSDPQQVIEQSIMSGKWIGLFAVKRKQAVGAARVSRHSGFEHIDYSEGIDNGRIT
jgi:hypothetical protein